MGSNSESLRNRIFELLNFPAVERCHELAVVYERCTLRELQEVFPMVVQSIFGVNNCSLGWGLRVVTKDNSPQCFDVLHGFFAPMGPMFELCYRLLNESIKFELSLELLPLKVTEMLQSGQYSMFYTDLINIDPFRRQVSTLLLNAFDYFILHFVVHGTFPLHKYYPTACQVHNERIKTVYFFLTAEYLSAFLPSGPDGLVQPTNICPTVKTPQPMPAQLLKPTYSPKYLKIPNVSGFGGINDSNSSQSQNVCLESARANVWRTESVLHFFTDIWLRYDIEEARDLPSSEFIRVVRILVKQTHAFASSVFLDQTSMVSLRKLAQPMLKSRIYPFLKTIIGRWPLDSSMSVVLELWLSYLQPWRYTFDWHNSSSANSEVPMSSRFDSFIADNIVIYTQIFVQILSRFQRLDFTSLRNVIMLHRLVKVFSQNSLPMKLCQVEQAYVGSSFVFEPGQKKISYSRVSIVSSSEWNSFFHEEVYTLMFGSEVRREMEQFIKTLSIARNHVKQEINSISCAIMERRSKFGFFKKLFANLFEDNTPTEAKLQEIKNIPDILDLAMSSLSAIFHIELSSLSSGIIYPQELNQSQSTFLYDNSEYMDISKVSPNQMMNNLAKIKCTIDPALLPIQNHECKLAVRFLYQLSCKLNEMYGQEMQLFWNRSDLCGKLARKILLPPMTMQWFDKSTGISELREDALPARIWLRPLASYKMLAIIMTSVIFGYYLWGAPSFGLIFLLLLFVFYLFILVIFF